MARRLVERGVRFVQVYHNNWDHHSNVAGRMPSQCKDIDRPCYALLEDLEQRVVCAELAVADLHGIECEERGVLGEVLDDLPAHPGALLEVARDLRPALEQDARQLRLGVAAGEEVEVGLRRLAAWGEAEIAEFDEKLSFKGRIEREGWVEQAKELAK